MNNHVTSESIKSSAGNTTEISVMLVILVVAILTQLPLDEVDLLRIIISPPNADVVFRNVRIEITARLYMHGVGFTQIIDNFSDRVIVVIH